MFTRVYISRGYPSTICMCCNLALQVRMHQRCLGRRSDELCYVSKFLWRLSTSNAHALFVYFLSNQYKKQELWRERRAEPCCILHFHHDDANINRGAEIFARAWRAFDLKVLVLVRFTLSPRRLHTWFHSSCLALVHAVLIRLCSHMSSM